MHTKKVVIIGGGAAGYFSAISAATHNKDIEIIIIERGKSVLEKVRVSGGGRCNVTNEIEEPSELVQYYPRGNKELLGPFYHFGSKEMKSWLTSHGVKLKTEKDGRVFPVSDSSETIIQCLIEETKKHKIVLRSGSRIDNLMYLQDKQQWKVVINQSEEIIADDVVICSGSNERIWNILKELGHTIIPPVPSLFTFNIQDARLRDLQGLSMPNAIIKIKNSKFLAEGPLLITHWGLSGPAILKLSSWAARELATQKYQFNIEVNWTGLDKDEIREQVYQTKEMFPRKLVKNTALFQMPSRLWERLMTNAMIGDIAWSQLQENLEQKMIEQLILGQFQVVGKSTFKEEFVTAGGVDLKEIDFRHFRSKLYPNLYMAGEVLNIDALTGGFNFQSAWTGAWIIGESIQEN